MSRRTALGVIAGSLFARVPSLGAGPVFRSRSAFNTGWKFILADPGGAQLSGFDDSAWQTPTLPHDWSIEQPFLETNPCGQAGGFSTNGIGWYRKQFTAPVLSNAEVLLLDFDGIYGSTQIWLNGTLIGTQTWGFTGAHYNLTPYLTAGINVLAVRVDNSNQPNQRWYSGSGIYRSCWITTASSFRIDQWGVAVVASGITAASATLTVSVTVVNPGTSSVSANVTTAIFDPHGASVVSGSGPITVTTGSTATSTVTLTVPSPLLWSPDTPVLYSAVSTLSLSDGSPVDGITTPVGIRDVQIDPDNGFLLNGANIKLKGVCLHPEIGASGAAVPLPLWTKYLTALKGIGCNALRLCHFPFSPDFLDLIDQLGFLAIGEAFDKWDLGVAPQFEYADFGANWQQWLLSMLRRDRNHPSIVIWSVGDEAGTPGAADHDALLSQLVNFVHLNEPQRPVMCALIPQIHGTVQDIANTVAQSSEIMDLMSVNYQEQFFDVFHQTAPSRAIIDSEAYPYYRGVPYGYDNSDPWFDSASRSFVAGHFVWAGVDYLGESAGWPSKGWPNALIDSMGSLRPAGQFFRSVWSSKPAVGLYAIDPAAQLDPGLQPWSWPSAVTHWNLGSTGSNTGSQRELHVRVPPHWSEQAGTNLIVQIQTPSNCDSVQLFVNGTSYGSLRPADFLNQTPIWNVTFVPGVVAALGIINGNVVASATFRTASSAASLLLVPETPILSAARMDVGLIDLLLVDGEGVTVPDDDRVVTLSLSGPASLVGFENGDTRGASPFRTASQSTNFGRALALVQSSGTPGAVTVRATVSGLPDATVSLQFE